MHALYKFSAVPLMIAMTALPTSCASGPRVARAEAPHPPPEPITPVVARIIEIEINDAPPGGTAKTSMYSLAVVDDFGWSRIESRAASGKLALQARSDRVQRVGPAIVRLDVTRNETSGPDLVVSQSVIYFAGRRTVLGRLARTDGGTTEIAMTTR